jgi:hypothetical protein
MYSSVNSIFHTSILISEGLLYNLLNSDECQMFCNRTPSRTGYGIRIAHNTIGGEPWGSIKCWDILEWLSDFWLFKKRSVQRNEITVYPTLICFVCKYSPDDDQCFIETHRDFKKNKSYWLVIVDTPSVDAV